MYYDHAATPMFNYVTDDVDVYLIKKSDLYELSYFIKPFSHLHDIGC